jgi:hypothetical protein
MKHIVWSLVLVVLVASLCSAQSVLYFPQFVDGSPGQGFWGSAIAVSNPAAAGTAAASGTITVTKFDGTPLNITFADDSLAPTTNTFQLAGGQTKIFYSPTLSGNLQPFVNGFATVTSNLPVAAGLVFIEGSASFSVISQAGVPGVTPLTRQAAVAVRNSGENTGVAVAYPGTGTANITYQLLDKSGALIVPAVTKALGANNQTAFYITDLFPSVPAQVAGTLRIVSDQPIVAVALLIAQPQGLLSTIPVFPVQ